MFNKIIIFICGAIFCTMTANAQLAGSINAFSPYTMYGLGDMKVRGTIASRTMGGIGVGMRTPTEFNYQNPASLSAIPQQTAIFNFAGLNSNYYNQTEISKSAHNSVDLHDIGFAIPIIKGIGIGFSLTPYTSVGYNTAIVDENQNIIENIGRAVYSYYGDGGVSQFNTSIGAKLGAGFSVGATMHYTFGSISRHWDATLYPLLTSESLRNIATFEAMHVNKLLFTFGAQYEARIGKDDMISFGFTYQPKGVGNFDKQQISIASDKASADTIAYTSTIETITFPEKFAAGVYYNNTKFGIGADYSYQNWEGAFETPNNITLGAVHDIRLGMQYTPDRMNFRSFFSRLTYRAGARYATSYLFRNGHQLTDWAVDIGVQLPFKRGSASNISIGFEYGQRGAKEAIIQEQYFKVLVGIKLFVNDDLWFVKRKYN